MQARYVGYNAGRWGVRILNIIRGKRLPPQRRVVYGPPGVGKSTFACSEPGALALGWERGLEHIGCARVVGPRDWDASLLLIREACSGPGDHTAVVLDTADKLEEQATEAVCKAGKKKALSDFSYGDGFEALVTRWRELLFILEGAEEKGRSVSIVAHFQGKTIDDPTLGSYGKYIPALNKRVWTATHQWADCVLWMNYEQGLVEGRAIMTDARLLYTRAQTGFEAKHRPNIASPIKLDWQAYADAVVAANRAPEEVRASIRALLKPEQREQAEESLKKMGDDTAQLVALESALKKKVAT